MRTPENTDEFIQWLFNHRCIGIDKPCYELAFDVSHIISRQINDEWRNKVLHCRNCHNKWHNRGVSDDDIKSLQERRAEYLEAIGREQYI